MIDISEYYQRAFSLLAGQFQDSPSTGMTNFQKMLFAILTQAQLINTQEVLLSTMRNLNDAQGVQLDGLGQILGLPRVSGQSDTSYREFLYFQIFINGAFGTPEQIIYALEFLTNASIVWYVEIYPAAYVLATNGLTFPLDPGQLVPTIQNISPAGVNLVGIMATYGTNPFVFCDDPIFSQLYVAPNPLDPTQLYALQVYNGASNFLLQVNAGETVNPNFGGAFAEALGVFGDYTIDTTGAGQLCESIQM